MHQLNKYLRSNKVKVQIKVNNYSAHFPLPKNDSKYNIVWRDDKFLF